MSPDLLQRYVMYGDPGQDLMRKPRSSNFDYDEATKNKIAKLAVKIGDRATARHFSQALGHPVHYWTVYNFKKRYLKRLQDTSLQPAPTGD